MSGQAVAAAPAGRYRVRGRVLVSLLLGRGTYRVTQLAAQVLLLPIWGTQRYGVYAGASATFSFLISLMVSGPEKTVLKLLPRAPRTGPPISEALAAILWVLPLPLLAAFALTTALGEHGKSAIYLGAATVTFGTGCTQLLIGLHRAAGRPRYDSRSFFVLTLLQLALLGVAASGRVQPLGYLATLVVAQTALNTVLLVRLGHPSLRIRSRAGFLRRVCWTALLMGSPDVCMYLAPGLLFALLGATAWAGQVGVVYVVTIIWTSGVNLLIYVLRVYAPATSLRGAGRSAAASRARAARIARTVAVADIALLGAFAAVLAGTGLLDATRHPGAVVWWAVLLAARTPTQVALVYAGYVLENSDATATRVTGAGATLGLVVALAVGAVAVPHLGGVGLIGALVAAEVVAATVIALRGGRRAAPVPTRPAGGRKETHVPA